jgi:hypothetical protein
VGAELQELAPDPKVAPSGVSLDRAERSAC